MRKPNRKFLNIVVAAAFAATLFGAANSRILANPAHASRKTLVTDYQVGADWFNSGDPATTAYVGDGAVEAMVYSNLVKLDPANGAPICDLCTKIKVSGGGKVYTFTLRKNAKFSNGDKVTAKTVVFTLNRAAHAPADVNEAATYDNLIKGINPSGTTSGTVGGIKATGTYKVRITLVKPAAYFLKALAYPTMYVVDPKVVAGHTINDYLTNTCKGWVGSGPFKLVCANGSSDKNSFYGGGSPKIRLQPNPKYFGKHPSYNVQVPFISNTDTAWTGFKSGQLSMGVFSPSTEFNTAKRMKGFRTYNTSIVAWTNINLYDKPFNNKNCRAAIVYAYDRKFISSIVPHVTFPWYQIVPKGMLGDFGNKGVPHYNLKLAKQYVKKCPAVKNIKYPIRQMQTREARITNQATISMYKKAGINAHPYELGVTDYLKARNTNMRKTHAELIGQAWQADYFDPQDYVSLLFNKKSIYNIGGFNNAKFESLIHKADVNTNVRARAKQYVQAQKILLNGYYIRMNFAYYGYENIRPNVTGVVCTAAYGYCPPKHMNWANIHVK